MLKISDIVFNGRLALPINRQKTLPLCNVFKCITCFSFFITSLWVNQIFAEQPTTKEFVSTPDTLSGITQINNFITIPCDQIWQPEELALLENQTYWLRAIDCAARLSSSSSRIIAKGFSAPNWNNSLKTVILIEAAGPSSTERKRNIELLNRYRAEFPTTLRPLLQTLRRQQELELMVIDEAERYKRLEQFSNTEIAALKEERDRIKLQFEETQQKLENIADIERQISAKRQQQNRIEVGLSDIENEQFKNDISSSSITNTLDDDVITENYLYKTTDLVKTHSNNLYSNLSQFESDNYKVGIKPSNALKNTLLAIQIYQNNQSTIPMIFENAAHSTRQKLNLPFDNLYLVTDK